ncbi:MAG: flagellar hook-associated protein FlgL [Thiobacillus sp.]|nr:flagellar hook-associated protein FlgL [Thiobacillus sp.]
MRISTQSLFESGALRLGELQTSLVKTQQQIGSGRRILSPSDDPIAAARALDVTQAQSLNTQYGRNRQYATDTLTTVEGTLSSVTSLLQDVRDIVIASGNGLLTDNERAFQATALASRFDELLGLANSRDAFGNYVFSGFQTDTPAFVKTPTGATYQGDSGQQLLQVEATRQMAVSNSGQSVFQGGGQDIFQTITGLVTLLQTPGTPAPGALTTSLGNVDLALNNVLTVRASVGSRLQELDSLNNFGEDRGLQYSQILSELQDLDYTEALTRLSQQQFTLEAAQRSFSTISKLSLFNFI